MRSSRVQLTNRGNVHVALRDGLHPLILLSLEPRELQVLVPGLVHLREISMLKVVFKVVNVPKSYVPCAIMGRRVAVIGKEATA